MSDFFATSPEIFSLWIETYKDRLEKSPNNMEIQKTMEFYKRCAEEDSRPSGKSHNMEDDLRRSRQISGKCKESEIYSQNLYAALCNNRFVKDDKEWHCSWRHAGGLVSHLREQGDYIDWYCSGIADQDGFVTEGFITDEVMDDINSIGWSAA